MLYTMTFSFCFAFPTCIHLAHFSRLIIFARILLGANLFASLLEEHVSPSPLFSVLLLSHGSLCAERNSVTSL